MYMLTDEINKELREVFGEEATEKVWSHLNSCNQREKELVASRDNWKSKYLRLKKELKGGKKENGKI